MALLTPPPSTSLGRVVRAEHEAARSQKKQRSKVRRLLRLLGISIAAFYFVMGFGSGSAQALPDPVGDAVEKVTHFCGPMDVPPPSSHEGFDTALGLNKDDSDLRRTVRTSIDDDLAEDTKTLGIDRARKAYDSGDEKIITTPTYERYGFNTLKWTNYGSSCFSPSYWFSPITNFALSMFVKFPMILGMGLLNFALDPNNVLYQAFALILTPFVKILTAIFEPWIYLFAPIGVLWVWIKSRASVQKTLQAVVWVIAIVGVFLWMGNNTSKIVTTANNIVTDFTGAAACHMMNFSEEDGGDGGEASDDAGNCGDDDGLSQINQALWHGVPYQTWLLGEVGPGEAQDSANDEAKDRLGWGPVLLNGMYVNYDDDGGKEVLSAIQYWNSRSYHSSSGDDTKTGYWTGDSNEGDGDNEIEKTNGAAWEDIPFLAHVKFLCDDKSTDGNGSEDAEHNRWMYKNQCDYTGAGTKDLISYFKGEEYAHQMVVAFAGGWATLAVVLAIGLAAVYLMLQKMLFFFLLAFGPIFLAMSTFADEKRRQFATRYFEILAANIMKQCVAVVVVLFVSYSMSALMNPPAGSDFPNIPWMAKPIFAMLFFIALIIFMIPMKNLMKAVAKGDVSVVDKVANAPADYAKKTAKGAAIAAAVVATGGAAAAAGAAGAGGAAGAATSLGKSGMLMRQAGSAMGRRGGVGKILSTAGKMQTLSAGMMNNKAAKESEKEANRQGALMLARSNPGKFQTDGNGQLTPQGMAAATAEFKKTSAEGLKHKQSQQLAQQQMQNFFAGHLAQTGERHAADPQHPDNLAKGNSSYQPASPEGSSENGSGPNGGQPSQGGGLYANQGFADAARERVDMASFGSSDIQFNRVADGGQVLQGMGVTEQDAIANPLVLINGENSGWGGGDVTQMDPTHALTPILHELKHAIAAGVPSEKADTLMDQAREVIVRGDGVPAQVSGGYATGQSAASFEPVQVIGAMPNLTDQTGWEDRADASFTMQAAAASIPADHPAVEPVRVYTSALANPSVDVSTVEGLRAQAIESFSSADWAPPSAGPDGGFAGDSVMAAAAGAGVGAAFGGSDGPGDGYGPAQPQQGPVRIDEQQLRDALAEDRAMRQHESGPGFVEPPAPAPQPQRTTESFSAPPSAPPEQAPVEMPRIEDDPDEEFRPKKRGRSGMYDYDDDSGDA